MKKLTDLISGQEKKALGLLGGVLGAALLVLFFVSLRERSAYLRGQKTLANAQETYKALDASRDLKKTERRRWEEAGSDLKEFRTKYFYTDAAGFKDLRLDLQKLFDDAGVYVTQLKYDYADPDKQKIQKVLISFKFKGSYPSMKRFLAFIERFPKFLTIEKIDFPSSSSQRGSLELNFILAAYNETE